MIMKKRTWHVRLMMLTIPQLFAALRVKVNSGWRELSWPGFPSDHYQLEFMNFLKWLDHFEKFRQAITQHEEWDEFAKKRLARMVMAVSLSLEASYYAGHSSGCELRGQNGGCMSKLNVEQCEDLGFAWLPGN